MTATDVLAPAPEILTQSVTTGRARSQLARKTREALLGYALVLPALLVFAVFVFWPFAKTIRQSFFRTPPFPGLPDRYAGFDLYQEVIAPSGLARAFGYGLIVGVVAGVLSALLAYVLRRASGRPTGVRALLPTFGWVTGGVAVVATVQRYHTMSLPGFAPRFANSVWVTMLFIALTVPISVVLGVGMAVLAHAKLKGIGVYRTVFSSTVISSVAVTSAIFYTLLNPQIGLIPYLLGERGGTSLLENPTWALPLVAAATVWQNLGLSFIVISSGLQSVPDELHEAAAVDGAGPWRRFWNVTLPMLSPTLFFVLVVGLIFALQTFGQIDILTQGGPNKKTTTIVYLINEVGLGTGRNPGYAAVIAIALFLITLAVTVLQLKVLERRVSYER
ncbi:MAG: carbohydrate ABC transporter permease [Acidimicrobiia bacterium]